jgi:hypothetical protein
MPQDIFLGMKKPLAADLTLFFVQEGQLKDKQDSSKSRMTFSMEPGL